MTRAIAEAASGHATTAPRWRSSPGDGDGAGDGRRRDDAVWLLAGAHGRCCTTAARRAAALAARQATARPPRPPTWRAACWRPRARASPGRLAPSCVTAQRMTPHAIVVLGMMAKMPGARASSGRRCTTCSACSGSASTSYYVEAHARTPSMLMRSPRRRRPALAAALIDAHDAPLRPRRPLGLPRAARPDGRCYGIERARLLRLLRASAELVVNLHGGTMPRPEHAAAAGSSTWRPTRCSSQVELHDGNGRTTRVPRARTARSSPSPRTSARPTARCRSPSGFALPADAPAGGARPLGRPRRGRRRPVHDGRQLAPGLADVEYRRRRATPGARTRSGASSSTLPAAHRPARSSWR